MSSTTQCCAASNRARALVCSAIVKRSVAGHPVVSSVRGERDSGSEGKDVVLDLLLNSKVLEKARAFYINGHIVRYGYSLRALIGVVRVATI